MRSGAFAMATKGNAVLYLDEELVEKSKDLGFNLSNTFENHLKHIITQFSTSNSVNNLESADNKVLNMGLPGFEPGSTEPKSTTLDQTIQKRLGIGCETEIGPSGIGTRDQVCGTALPCLIGACELGVFLLW